MHVADYSVVLDWLISHGSKPPSKAQAHVQKNWCVASRGVSNRRPFVVSATVATTLQRARAVVSSRSFRRALSQRAGRASPQSPPGPMFPAVSGLMAVVLTGDSAESLASPLGGV